MSLYSRRPSDNNSDVETGSNFGYHHIANTSAYITNEKNKVSQSNKQIQKVDKNISKMKKTVKKFPELKMIINGE